MLNLHEKMAHHGFESNDDYAFQIRCLLESPTTTVRTLNITGDSERRKTAFAHALAQALDFPHILYYDFTQQHPPLPEVILPPSRDEFGREEPPIEPLDETLGEACAQSEFEKILREIHLRVRTQDQLRHCLYGWTEDLEHTDLFDQALLPSLDRVVDQIRDYLGTEHIEVGGSS